MCFFNTFLAFGGNFIHSLHGLMLQKKPFTSLPIMIGWGLKSRPLPCQSEKIGLSITSISDYLVIFFLRKGINCILFQCILVHQFEFFFPFLKRDALGSGRLCWGVTAGGKSRWIMFMKMPHCCLSVVICLAGVFSFWWYAMSSLISLLLCLPDLGPIMLWGGFGRSCRCTKKSIWNGAKPGSRRSRVKRHMSRSSMKLRTTTWSDLLLCSDSVSFSFQHFWQSQVFRKFIFVMPSQGFEWSCQVKVRMLCDHELFIAKAQVQLPCSVCT